MVKTRLAHSIQLLKTIADRLLKAGIPLLNSNWKCAKGEKCACVSFMPNTRVKEKYHNPFLHYFEISTKINQLSQF